jgi:S-methylmethionine-dependent homocysteine/selenocysteine methylase
LFHFHLKNAKWLFKLGYRTVFAEALNCKKEARAVLLAYRKAGFKEIWVSFLVDPSNPDKLLSGESLKLVLANSAKQGAHALLINCVHTDVLEKALPELVLFRGKCLIGAYPNKGKMIFKSGRVAFKKDAHAAQSFNKFKSLAQVYQLDIIGVCCGHSPKEVIKLAKL